MKKATVTVAFIALLIASIAETMLVDSGKANPYDLPVDNSIQIYRPNVYPYQPEEYDTITLNIKVILVYGQYDESWSVHLDSICYSLDGQPLVYVDFTVEDYVNYGRDKQDFLYHIATVKLENLPEGSHTVTAYANTTAYLNYRSTSYNFTVDSPYQAPLIKVLSPTSQMLSPSSNVSLVFTASGAVNWIGYSLDGGENVTVNGNVTLSGLSSKNHTVIVCANDTFGNAGESDTITFTVDNPELISEETPQTPTPFEGIFIAGAIGAIICVGLLVYFRKKQSARTRARLS